MRKSKKTKKRRIGTFTLEPDGFSIHTVELSMKLTKAEWRRCKNALYQQQKDLGEHWFYPDKACEGHHICTRYADAGIRIRLERSGTEENKGHFIRMIVNPRRLIYPQSDYLGILPPDEDSIELLEKTFRELFRKSPFDNKINQYYLTRVDLCTNIRCNRKKIFRELVRLLHKTTTPKKYQRVFYQHKDKKKANQYNKHYIRLACGSQELVIYDKTYQMSENNLVVEYEGLPSGVLRVEVHYTRTKLRELQKQLHTDNPMELLQVLIQESKVRICALATKCYPDLEYHSYEAGLAMVEASRYSDQTKEAMRTLLSQMRRRQTIDAALHWMDKHDLKTDGLLKKFEKIGLSPIPLRKGYAAERMPGLVEILRSIGEKPVEVELVEWKWR